ncbi:hypothetical protein ACHAQE_009846 [Botrytis cinerea]
MNRHIDLAAILSLFRPDSLWEDMGCDRKTNPFRLEDGHHFAVLRANNFTVHRHLNTLPDKDKVKRGEWLGKIHDISPLKRGFGTIIDGVSIGSATPPVKTSIIDLDIDEKEVNVMEGILAENKKGLVFFLRKVHQEIGADLSFQPDTKDGTQLLDVLSQQSPKLKLLYQVILDLVVTGGSKFVIWTEYPWEQVFVKVVLKFIGVNPHSLHAEMNNIQRAELVKQFNESGTTHMILITTYKVAGREKKRLRFFKKFESRCTIPKPWSEAGTAAAGLRDAEQMTEKRQRERLRLIKKFGASAKIGDFPLTDAEKEELKIQGDSTNPMTMINEAVESDQPSTQNYLALLIHKSSREQVSFTH